MYHGLLCNVNNYKCIAHYIMLRVYNIPWRGEFNGAVITRLTRPLQLQAYLIYQLVYSVIPSIMPTPTSPTS